MAATLGPSFHVSTCRFRDVGRPCGTGALHLLSHIGVCRILSMLLGTCKWPANCFMSPPAGVHLIAGHVKYRLPLLPAPVDSALPFFCHLPSFLLSSAPLRFVVPLYCCHPSMAWRRVTHRGCSLFHVSTCRCAFVGRPREAPPPFPSHRHV